MRIDRLMLLGMFALAIGCSSDVKPGDQLQGDGDHDQADSDPTDNGPADDDPNPSDTDGPQLAGCPLLPANHVFNSRIDGLRVHPNSDDFIATIGDRTVHLDLGTQTDQSENNFYGIPYNIVNGNALTWTQVDYDDPDTAEESDCGDASRNMHSPCTGSAFANASYPIPASPIVEGGISDDLDVYGDHHMLLLDRDRCELWELGNMYKLAGTGWRSTWTAYFNLRSNDLRPAGWTSADAAGFPILPLLIRQSEAATGEIKHAFRFTINSNKIRRAYTWPARHLTGNGTTSTAQPPMGQLFRLKASYQIPAGASTQSRAIMVALQRYGMYIADGGSDMFITGEPSANWDEDIFDTVQDLRTDDFEAVDLEAVAAQRAGFDVNSGALP